MREDIYHKMHEVEGRHWWFAAKRGIIVHLLRKYLRPLPDGLAPSIADVGCGCGCLLEQLSSSCTVRGVDVSPTAVDFCTARGLDVVSGSLPDDLTLDASAFDAVIMSDVIEHVADDVAAVRAAAALLRPGGVMIVTVPAMKAMWSAWDVAHGHVRRYSAGSLAKALSTSGLAVEMLSYYNFALLPLAAGVRLAKAVVGVAGTAELEPPPGWINAALKWILLSERHLLGRVPLPWGLSLVAVLRKTQSKAD
jgi:SAM-dependent methyltransferase